MVRIDDDAQIDVSEGRRSGATGCSTVAEPRRIAGDVLVSCTIYRLCYLRGPDGIIVALAKQLRGTERGFAGGIACRMQGITPLRTVGAP